MFKNPPLALVVGALLYLGYLVWSVAVSPAVVVDAGRLALSGVLFYFIFRGSQAAARILAVLCALSALILLLAAVATFQSQPRGAVTLTVMTGLLALYAAYLWRSKAMKAFQGRWTSSAS